MRHLFTRIEPPSVVPSQDSRLKQPGKGGDPKDQLSEEELEAKEREESGLVRSGKLFGGLWAGGYKIMISNRVYTYYTVF